VRFGPFILRVSLTTGLLTAAVVATSSPVAAETQLAELTINPGAPNDGFGDSVAFSGNTAVVGVPGLGGACVFTFNGDTWAQTAELIPSGVAGSAGELLGISVALSGNTAIVGAPFHRVGRGSAPGAAYVFTNSGGTWTQTARLIASDGANEDLFGISVALSGTTAIVGANSHQVGTNSHQGAAYVFTESGGTWTQKAELTASDGAAWDSFGESVALSVSVSGTTAIVGAPNHRVGTNDDQGAAYVFTNSGGTWTQKTELTASDGAGSDNFGSRVAVSASGSTAVVGAPLKQVGSNTQQGGAYVFTKSRGTWTQAAELIASDGATNDNFGLSVAASHTTVVVGAPYHRVGSNIQQGAAYVFTKSGGTWTQAAELIASDGAALDNFGFSAAVSHTTVVVGAPNHSVGSNSEQGAAYVFDA
jgi:hypothetical protein